MIHRLDLEYEDLNKTIKSYTANITTIITLMFKVSPLEVSTKSLLSVTV